eukprot:gnl/TRDRNA2_/TRDRNA2_183968_c0_seq1.p1 gnl/TRDRNA2_/TRDRNA2_183968_c0~~gnl/TRDRNA2_/TRDRNA2_183968_c0_seq1.p1  ORF type:complete len:365 (-),score=78.93 gnl/TRDRNA2_/TRDRNA2_183968_c0_seq1:260-1297(-)
MWHFHNDMISANIRLVRRMQWHFVFLTVAASMQPATTFQMRGADFAAAASRAAGRGISGLVNNQPGQFKVSGEDEAMVPQTFALLQEKANEQAEVQPPEVAAKGGGSLLALALGSENPLTPLHTATVNLIANWVLLCLIIVGVVRLRPPKNNQADDDACDPEAVPLQTLKGCSDRMAEVDAHKDLAEVEQPSSINDSSPERADVPNFSGNWRLHRIDGNMDAFMQEMGVGWHARVANKFMGYGIEKQTQHIVQVGNAFRITTVDLWGRRLAQKFLVDGGEQLSSDAEGHTIIINPRRDGQVLTVGHRTNTGDTIQVQKRILDGDTMKLDVTAPNGATVTRVFVRI